MNLTENEKEIIIQALKQRINYFGKKVDNLNLTERTLKKYVKIIGESMQVLKRIEKME